MVKKKPYAPRARQPRSPRALVKTNQKVKPRVLKPRRKGPPEPPTRALIKKRKNVVVWRGARPEDDRAMDWALSSASQHYRQVYAESRGIGPIRKKKVVGKKPRKRTCKAKVIFPVNLEQLEALIPRAHRAKPTTAGNEIIYVPAVAGPLERWVTATVERISRHRDTNWIIVKKPCPKPSENQYLAIDSTCVWLAPINNSFPVALLRNVGVYVLFCERLGHFYVGESNDVRGRMGDHSTGKIVWTRTWNGDFVRVAPITAQGKVSFRQHEGREARALAKIHGWECVRGGGMTSNASTPSSSQA